MTTCEHGSEIGQCTCTADHCSKCGGERDAEGWCVNYCEDYDGLSDQDEEKDR